MKLQLYVKIAVTEDVCRDVDPVLVREIEIPFIPFAGLELTAHEWRGTMFDNVVMVMPNSPHCSVYYDLCTGVTELMFIDDGAASPYFSATIDSTNAVRTRVGAYSRAGFVFENVECYERYTAWLESAI